jgi:ribosomal protein S18 acetylase RimI-like enzyme
MELRGDDEIWFDAGEWERYAELADEHVRAGRLAHFVLVDADDPALDRWVGLSFGRQQVYASAPVGAPAYAGPVRVRPGDLESALRFSAVLFDHLSGPPVWSFRAPRAESEVRAEWEEFLAEPETTHLVAELDGRAVAHMALHGSSLEVAATLPEARGRGAMRALWAAAQEHAAGERWETDWRATNLEADACWRRLGFRPTRYRLHRLVGR